MSRDDNERSLCVMCESSVPLRLTRQGWECPACGSVNGSMPNGHREAGEADYQSYLESRLPGETTTQWDDRCRAYWASRREADDVAWLAAYGAGLDTLAKGDEVQ